MAVNQGKAAQPSGGAGAELGVTGKGTLPVGTLPESAARKPGNRKQLDRGALATAIPTVPVAVSAAQVANERQRRVQPPRTTGKNRPTVAFRQRPDVVPSVEALRNRWLANA